MVACGHTAGGASPRVSQPLAITVAGAGLLMSMESSPHKINDEQYNYNLYNYLLGFTLPSPMWYAVSLGVTVCVSLCWPWSKQRSESSSDLTMCFEMEMKN